MNKRIRSNCYRIKYTHTHTHIDINCFVFIQRKRFDYTKPIQKDKEIKTTKNNNIQT